ncbi:unnamed protein product [Lactuca virosa]|uniref:Uncharacterized protein n=1 Tax=Lactuca virosa TaxID=75947 RepID=A0AAU9PF00_9ASTR|nr:unnamed protein product [Lactuca virosa]
MATMVHEASYFDEAQFDSKMKELFLSDGLVFFTSYDELWVGHGSRAAEEKQYFDSHLEPFCRVKQLTILPRRII